MPIPSRTTLFSILAFITAGVLVLLIALSPNIRAPFSTEYNHHNPFNHLSIADLGFVNDPVLNDGGIFHDGGGGATQNGYHVMVFADSSTLSAGFNFVHNSVAYYGYVSSPFNQWDKLI
jgi:hypothetical protein